MPPLSVAWYLAQLCLIAIAAAYRICPMGSWTTSHWNHPTRSLHSESPKREGYRSSSLSICGSTITEWTRYSHVRIYARPRKSDDANNSTADDTSNADNKVDDVANSGTGLNSQVEEAPKRGRGRPKKAKPETAPMVPDISTTVDNDNMDDGMTSSEGNQTNLETEVSDVPQLETVGDIVGQNAGGCDDVVNAELNTDDQDEDHEVVSQETNDDVDDMDTIVEEQHHGIMGGDNQDGSEVTLTESSQDVVECQDNSITTETTSSGDDKDNDDTSDTAPQKTFVERLEEQLASKKTRLPESFYAEDVYSPLDNTKLPEGCKTLMDFFNMPKNFDFKSMVDLALYGTESADGLNSYGPTEIQKVENPVYTGKYPDNLSDYIFYPDIPKRRYTTSATGEPEAADLGTVFDELKGKKISDMVPPETASPVQKIKESDFMFDSYHYIRHYLTHLNQYNYNVISSHHKDTNTLNHYLNNEYIQRIYKQFPPERDHTEKIREYFMGLLPGVMDNLVNLIKNDPNKDRIPSPPLHDMSLAPGFKLPDYMVRGSGLEDLRTGGYQEADYVKYSSLKGLHEPEKHLEYPYADTEPLYQRQLLSTYLDIVKTGDLGEPECYKKFKSHAASIRNEMYKDQTKLPQEIYGKADGTGSVKKPTIIEEPTSFTKVYERGSRKTSVALVYLEPGNGHIIINNRDGYQYVRYCTQRIREMLEPLDVLYVYEKFNIVAVAHGGGISGQAGAIRHALARYLTRVLSPKLEPYLSLLNLTKADTRQVERKKTNLRKARKKEHYSKR